jgi:hypothetical protein
VCYERFNAKEKAGGGKGVRNDNRMDKTSRSNVKK